MNKCWSIPSYDVSFIFVQFIFSTSDLSIVFNNSKEDFLTNYAN